MLFMHERLPVVAESPAGRPRAALRATQMLPGKMRNCASTIMMLVLTIICAQDPVVDHQGGSQDQDGMLTVTMTVTVKVRPGCCCPV